MASRSPPIGIQWIEIKDFRRIDSLRLDFTGADGGPSDIVVLGGPNGCGKTTILEACLIVLGYDGAPQRSKEKGAIRTGADEWKISAEARYKASRFRVGQWYHRTGARPATGVSGAPPQIPCLYFSSWRSPKLVGALPITAGKRDTLPDDTEPNRIWRMKQHLIDSRAHNLMSLGTPLAGSNVYEEHLGRLNAVWSEFHPRSAETFVVGPVGADPSDGFDVFLRRSDGRMVQIDALSSGQLELFALFGSLMLTKFTEGVVVIDEPELHLDPQWHALMLRAIREFMPAAQLIVATHSPKVYDSVLSFQRHFLVPDNDPRAQSWKAAEAVAP